MTQEFTKVAKWQVDEMESEPGWGLRLDECHLFDTFEEAEAFVKRCNYNADGTRKKPSASGWHMWAEEPRVVSVKVKK